MQRQTHKTVFYTICIQIDFLEYLTIQYYYNYFIFFLRNKNQKKEEKTVNNEYEVHFIIEIRESID